MLKKKVVKEKCNLKMNELMFNYFFYFWFKKEVQS